jgi:hypothetical protein
MTRLGFRARDEPSRGSPSASYARPMVTQAMVLSIHVRKECVGHSSKVRHAGCKIRGGGVSAVKRVSNEKWRYDDCAFALAFFSSALFIEQGDMRYARRSSVNAVAA